MHRDTKPDFSKEMLKGILDLLVLHVIARSPKHGYLVTKSIAELTDGQLAIQDGTLYPILHRLEQKAQISGVWVESEQARKRKEYRITPAGREALREQAAQWGLLIRILNQVTKDIP